MEKAFWVGVELGGQSIKIALSCSDPWTIDTSTIFEHVGKPPKEVLEQVVEWITKETKKSILAIGIGSFGPVDLDKKSKTYGYITTTPKKGGWKFTDVLGPFRKSFPSVPINFDTDVQAPALSESKFFKVQNLCYITVGTGIGLGLVVNGEPVHGLLHPNGGHISAPLHEHDIRDGFKGVCDYHGNCIEGMSCAASIYERAKLLKREEDIKDQTEIKNLPADDPIFDRVAYYLSHLCANCFYFVSCEKIVIGGGVMNNEEILPKIHRMVPKLLGGYLKHEKIEKHIDQLIVKSKHHEDAGVIGCLELARRILGKSEMKKK